MSTKTFCDYCGEQIHGKSLSRIDTSTYFRRPDRMPRNIYININLTTDKNHMNFEGDICTACIWRVIDDIDPRPKQIATGDENNEPNTDQ